MYIYTLERSVSILITTFLLLGKIANNPAIMHEQQHNSIRNLALYNIFLVLMLTLPPNKDDIEIQYSILEYFVHVHRTLIIILYPLKENIVLKCLL